MIPKSERDTFDEAVATLGKHFKPKINKELHGVEFCHLIQANESIEQFGITVQRLGNIPSLPLLSEEVCNLSSPFD